ncbi:hypothetical protein B7463_g10891, partial [Scytalidium lignicola]
MASDSKELVPLPNYKQSVGTVFEEMTRAVMEKKRFPNILFFRSSERAPEERPPSWIPDWLEMAYGIFEISCPRQAVLLHIKPPIVIEGQQLKMRDRILAVIDGLSTQITDSVEQVEAIANSISMEDVDFGAGLVASGTRYARKHAALEDWLISNSKFEIDGMSLGRWFNYAETALEEASYRVGKALGCGMRLMTTTAGQVGMAHS